MSSTLLNRLLIGVLLGLVQGAAALPWVMLLLPGSRKAWLRRSDFWLYAASGALGLGLVITGLLVVLNDPELLESLGRVYGSLLHAQLTADFFVAAFALLMAVWPKGGAVAQAAFREGIRQPLFWLIMVVAVAVMVVMQFFPYFTFGEDYQMVKELGQDIVMLMAVGFGILVASTSISEEIEGRTAVTLMSKPVSRRQFLLGKYFGILLAALVISTSLGWFFNWTLLFKHWYDSVDPVPFPAAAATFLQTWAPAQQAQALLRGVCWWMMDAAEVLPGLVMGFGQVMVLLAVAVCLATRLPVAANIVTCAVVYVISHLSPTLLSSVQNRAQFDPAGGSTVTSMLMFVAQLFDRVLPGLQLFKPTQINDAPIPVGDMTFYAGEVLTYSLLYTAIVLLFGLVLFEDRDLA
jgi:ABC-type transport system involved in multi-copper enzyme maturation permease subunit